MGYIEEHDLFRDTGNDLHKKVSRAIDVAARNVVNEDPGTANHAERFVWASKARQNPDNILNEAHQWMLAVLDNPTIAAAGNASTDNDVQFVVDSLVDTMAGV